MIKLNLGCGVNQLPGFTNIDINANHNPDLVMDLNKKWKIKTSSVDYIYARAILEHLDSYEFFFKQAHKVLVPRGTLEILVPHYSYPDAYFPTHKHYFSGGFFTKGFNYHSGTNYGFRVIKVELVFSNNVLVQKVIGFIPNLNTYLWEQLIGRAVGVKVILQKSYSLSKRK